MIKLGKLQIWFTIFAEFQKLVTTENVSTRACQNGQIQLNFQSKTIKFGTIFNMSNDQTMEITNVTC